MTRRDRGGEKGVLGQEVSWSSHPSPPLCQHAALFIRNFQFPRNSTKEKYMRKVRSFGVRKQTDGPGQTDWPWDKQTNPVRWTEKQTGRINGSCGIAGIEKTSHADGGKNCAKFFRFPSIWYEINAIGPLRTDGCRASCYRLIVRQR